MNKQLSLFCGGVGGPRKSRDTRKSHWEQAAAPPPAHNAIAFKATNALHGGSRMFLSDCANDCYLNEASLRLTYVLHLLGSICMVIV